MHGAGNWDGRSCFVFLLRASVVPGLQCFLHTPILRKLHKKILPTSDIIYKLCRAELNFDSTLNGRQAGQRDAVQRCTWRQDHRPGTLDQRVTENSIIQQALTLVTHTLRYCTVTHSHSYCFKQSTHTYTQNTWMQQFLVLLIRNKQQKSKIKMEAPSMTESAESTMSYRNNSKRTKKQQKQHDWLYTEASQIITHAAFKIQCPTLWRLQKYWSVTQTQGFISAGFLLQTFFGHEKGW